MKLKKKKNRYTSGVIYSDVPPAGWPSEAEFAIVKSMMVEKAVREAEPKLDKSINAVDKLKHDLCKEFYRCFEDSEMMQKDFAKKLKITESRVSEILSYRYETYTIDKLLTLLVIIKPETKFELIA
jgi:predicted XRE-type DNA-binding protein